MKTGNKYNSNILTAQVTVNKCKDNKNIIS